MEKLSTQHLLGWLIQGVCKIFVKFHCTLESLLERNVTFNLENIIYFTAFHTRCSKQFIYLPLLQLNSKEYLKCCGLSKSFPYIHGTERNSIFSKLWDCMRFTCYSIESQILPLSPGKHQTIQFWSLPPNNNYTSKGALLTCWGKKRSKQSSYLYCQMSGVRKWLQNENMLLSNKLT